MFPLGAPSLRSFALAQTWPFLLGGLPPEARRRRTRATAAARRRRQGRSNSRGQQSFAGRAREHACDGCVRARGGAGPRPLSCANSPVAGETLRGSCPPGSQGSPARVTRRNCTWSGAGSGQGARTARECPSQSAPCLIPSPGGRSSPWSRPQRSRSDSRTLGDNGRVGRKPPASLPL
jgi:hypothetical protein